MRISLATVLAIGVTVLFSLPALAAAQSAPATQSPAPAAAAPSKAATEIVSFYPSKTSGSGNDSARRCFFVRS